MRSRETSASGGPARSHRGALSRVMRESWPGAHTRDWKIYTKRMLRAPTSRLITTTPKATAFAVCVLFGQTFLSARACRAGAAGYCTYFPANRRRGSSIFFLTHLSREQLQQKRRERSCQTFSSGAASLFPSLKRRSVLLFQGKTLRDEGTRSIGGLFVKAYRW